MKPTTDDLPKVEEKKGDLAPPSKTADLDRRRAKKFSQNGHEVTK